MRSITMPSRVAIAGNVSLALRRAFIPPVIVLAAATAVASCVAPPSPPRKVEETKPSVTYKYRGDSELVGATRRAEDYCRNYGALPRTVNITDDPDGSSTVVFDCDRTLTAVAPPVPPRKPSVSYTYRSDRELVDATGTAATYCRTYNAPPRMATITSNADGTKTVVFDCGP